jgi:hypothetical protein
MRNLPTLVLLLLGLGYWQIICLLAGVREPWDAPAYWIVAYPFSLILSGVASVLMGRQGRFAGLVLTLAQFPILIAHAELDPMILFSLLLILLLSIPAFAISAGLGYIVVRHRGG